MIDENEILTAIRAMWAKGFLAATDGNFSFKSQGKIWITPSGVRKHGLNPGCFIDAHRGESASSELKLHLKVYEKAPNAKVVFHAHPPTAIAWSIAHLDQKEIPPGVISELVLACGAIPIAEYARPGTEDLAKSVESFLPESKVIVMRRHGALTWGESVEEAWNGMERLEHACEVLHKIEAISKLSSFSQEDLEWLLKSREKIGNRSL